VAEVAENTIVDGRYRITTRIGTGGMADVYCAHDEHLGRDVALKVLHRRFAQDQEFVERFRREASAAAGLQHPNVVHVYDRGQYDGTYYIAMEFLRGRTLKDVIAQEAPLGQERAIDITVQILKAAGAGHRRGIIHRDFKPQNVIVDDEDRVKVTDFGIARAGASEITETGSIMGTAQYLSPEQAQGTAAGETSDLYSIGVMLYEMLAGGLPFTGESAVAIALRHLTEPPPPLYQQRPDIHPGLEAVVMQALAKDPAHRFRDADGFIAALEYVRPEIGSSTGQVTAAFAPPTDVPVGRDTFVAGPPPHYPPEERGRRQAWPWILLALLVAALAAGAVLLAQRADEVLVPSVVGAPADRAQALLEQRGFEVGTQRKPSLQPVDDVIQQDPVGGDKAEKGSTVTLTVSDGPPSHVVPSVERLPTKLAVRKLQKAGFKVDLDTENSDTIRKGLAIRTVPDGGTLAQVGDRVRLFVSSGVEKVAVPNVVGLDQDTAERALQDKGFVAAVEREDSGEPEGNVLRQRPPAGTKLAKDERVTIVVSKGPQKVAVPDVVGLTRGDARGELQNAGFHVAVRERTVTEQTDEDLVLDQRPGHGTQLKKGRTVIIFVGKYQAPPEPTETETAPTTPDGTAAPSVP
jgi:beta-lactam-binding protein with PASTA domain